MTIKYAIAAAIIAVALPQVTLAQTKRPVDVGGYCEVVEKQIVALANTAATANDDLARFTSDQPTADPAKFSRANALLQSVTESLKEKETEWHHLGCMQIIYHPSGSK
jgi:hypothetical protein